MAIVAKCPNGHVLKVKNEFAGKSGLCPHCHTRVFVPMPIQASEKARISDDEIMGLLGEPEKAAPEAVEAEPESVHDPVPVKPRDGSAIDLMGSSILKKQKLCPNCKNLTSQAFTHCPRCGTPLPDLVKPKK